MNMRIVLCAGLILAGMAVSGITVAQQAGFVRPAPKQLTMKVSVNDFSTAISAGNAVPEYAPLSDLMPEMVPFGTVHTVGELPFRITSSVVETTYEKTFTFIFDTSDGSPFVGLNAYPGAGGGPIKYLCFDVGDSLSGNVPVKVWDMPFSVIHTYAAVYNDSGGLLHEVYDADYVFPVFGNSVYFGLCYYHLRGGVDVGPDRPATAELAFTISNDVIFRNGFQ